MKTLAAMIALALLAPAASFAAAPAPTAAPAGPPPADLSGTWAAVGVLGPGEPATPVCTFQQALEMIRGSCKGPHAIGLAEGTVKGRAVSWTWKPEPYTPGTPAGATATFDGTLGADNVITGSMSMLGRTGTLTAKKQ